MREVCPSKAYRLLEAGPIVLVTTAWKRRTNIMTIGFHMVVSHSPPLLGAVLGPWNHSFRALQETGECVLAIPGADLAEKVVDIGNCSGADLDKFTSSGLTRRKARHVRAPLVVDCLANVECRVADTALVDKYSLFILEAVAIWVDDDRAERRMLHHNGDGTFHADGELFDLQDRMTLWKEFQVPL